MKKHFLCIALVAICFAMTSCKKDLICSCDPKIDKWTKEHLQDISLMTRSDLIKFDDPVMRAIFGAMSPDQKYNVWMDKFNNLLQCNWSKDQKNHLLAMRSFITNNKFIFEDNEHSDDQFLLFVYKWREYAKDTLGWDDKTISALFNTPRDVIHSEEEDGTTCLYVKPQLGTGTVDCDGKKKCDTNCNDTMNWCANRDISMDCTTGGCDKANYCGWFWCEECNGLCHS